MDPALLKALKALSDASRLRIVGLLASRPYAVEELADALGLSAPTVAHHLKRLRSADLVRSVARHPYVEYSLAVDRLHEVGRMLDRLETSAERSEQLPGPGGEPLPAFDAKVLRAFVQGGRLTSIPAQEKKRLVVLRWVRERCFPEAREYQEREVNERLATVHEDTAALRRYLVESRLMSRSGGIYRRIDEPANATEPAQATGVAAAPTGVAAAPTSPAAPTEPAQALTSPAAPTVVAAAPTESSVAPRHSR
jgi:DNA-binding transcriptional ArsR family regulator